MRSVCNSWAGECQPVSVLPLPGLTWDLRHPQTFYTHDKVHELPLPGLTWSLQLASGSTW